MTKKNHMTTTIAEFLTVKEMASAVALYEKALPGTFAKLCDEQIISPNIERIEKKLGQPCHPRYLAYMVEYALNVASDK